MNYGCPHCDYFLVWPRWTGPHLYLMPGGQTYRLETKIGWCYHCNGMQHFELLDKDAPRILYVLESLQQEASEKLNRWGLIGRWLCRGSAREIDAYQRLEIEERARLVFLASRAHPCCLTCGNPPAADAFDEKYFKTCVSCGSSLERVEPVARFHYKYVETYYDQNGQKTGPQFQASNPPRADDECLKNVRFRLWAATSFLGEGA